MNLTSEQQLIINSTGNIKINAVAGAGKTTTLIAYAKARPANSKILYLAFNRSVKLEAIKKFEAAGLTNVKVETAHSLAFKHVIPGSGYKVKSTGYNTNDIATLITDGLPGSSEKHAQHIAANHINKFIAYFCNSDVQKVQELNYAQLVKDKAAKHFVLACYPYIEQQTRLLLAKMNAAQIDITHDFYLKKFQLQNPVLPYDFILFDEAQDASAAMLDVFLKQPATKIIVGDTHQQIYGWRHAVNSLQKADFRNYTLNTSFRFGNNLAQMAMQVLQFKQHIHTAGPLSINGSGVSTATKTKAVIARTNLGLLLKAIDLVTNDRKLKKIYFEGNINTYTYADDGASLYDVLNLYNNKKHLIRDTLIAGMQTLDDLEEYIEKTEDVQLGMMVEIVKEYGNEIHDIIKTIKHKHIDGDNKDEAQLIFSTVHRSKGMEYDEVFLADDFITEDKLKPKEKTELEAEEEIDTAKLNEEINLLYVAATRAKYKLHIPQKILPVGVLRSTNIIVVPPADQAVNKKESLYTTNALKSSGEAKKYSVRDVKLNHTGAYDNWTPPLDKELTNLYCDGVSVKAMAQHFGRTNGAILSRIKKLALPQLYGNVD